ncbi:hypothetical protein DFH29DRAFT_870796 [Suillus ampliporus]|nr:hypothetical protein DFH29DRAFT_870796 [Suillus ampliporus]
MRETCHKLPAVRYIVVFGKLVKKLHKKERCLFRRKLRATVSDTPGLPTDKFWVSTEMLLAWWSNSHSLVSLIVSFELCHPCSRYAEKKKGITEHRTAQHTKHALIALTSHTFSSTCCVTPFPKRGPGNKDVKYLEHGMQVQGASYPLVYSDLKQLKIGMGFVSDDGRQALGRPWEGSNRHAGAAAAEERYLVPIKHSKMEMMAVKVPQGTPTADVYAPDLGRAGKYKEGVNIR